MKINVANKPTMIRIERLLPGDCFRYWPDHENNPDQFRTCMKTDGRFCISDCMEAWPSRYVELENGNECGTSNDMMVEPLDLVAKEN